MKTGSFVLAIAIAVLTMSATPPAPAIVISDNFNNNALDTALWSLSANSYCSALEQNGRVEMTLGASAHVGLEEMRSGRCIRLLVRYEAISTSARTTSSSPGPTKTGFV